MRTHLLINVKLMCASYLKLHPRILINKQTVVSLQIANVNYFFHVDAAFLTRWDVSEDCLYCQLRYTIDDLEKLTITCSMNAIFRNISLWYVRCLCFRLQGKLCTYVISFILWFFTANSVAKVCTPVVHSCFFPRLWPLGRACEIFLSMTETAIIYIHQSYLIC